MKFHISNSSDLCPLEPPSITVTVNVNVNVNVNVTLTVPSSTVSVPYVIKCQKVKKIKNLKISKILITEIFDFLNFLTFNYIRDGDCGATVEDGTVTVTVTVTDGDGDTKGQGSEELLYMCMGIYFFENCKSTHTFSIYMQNSAQYLNIGILFKRKGKSFTIWL